MTGEELDVLDARWRELHAQYEQAKCQFQYALERYFRLEQLDSLLVKAAAKGIDPERVLEGQVRMQRDAHRLWNKYFWGRIRDCDYG